MGKKSEIQISSHENSDKFSTSLITPHRANVYELQFPQFHFDSENIIVIASNDSLSHYTPIETSLRLMESRGEEEEEKKNERIF